LQSSQKKDELVQLINHHIGPIAKPDKIQLVKGLPKTRSGKIMRRILRKIAAGDINNFGDISTLEASGMLQEIIENRL
ncbi:MAG: acetyl-coenzyme A synthetase, partial [Halobacteriovoraceae bacterium]|nr:acetyl-coenzyme A synthetase [Halobacteriovoraceae bacterium]